MSKPMAEECRVMVNLYENGVFDDNPFWRGSLAQEYFLPLLRMRAESLADDPAAVKRAKVFTKEAPDKWRFLANADIDHGDYPEYLAKGVLGAAEGDA